MHLVEVVLDGITVTTLEHRGLQIHRDRMFLPYVAHISGIGQRHFRGVDTAGLQGSTTLRHQFIEYRLQIVKRHIRQFGEPGLDEVVAQIGVQHAKGTEVSGCTRNDDSAHADFPGNGRRMQGPGAAVSNQRKGGCIQATLGRYALDRIRHRGDGNTQYAVGGFHHIHAQGFADVLQDGLLRCSQVKLHFSAKKTIGAQPSEHQIGIGDRRQLATSAIASWPWFSTCALRTDP